MMYYPGEIDEMEVEIAFNDNLIFCLLELTRKSTFDFKKTLTKFASPMTKNNSISAL